MMKKIIMIVIVVSTMLLSACSLLNEVNDSVEYVNQTTEHIIALSDFANEAPQLLQDAVLDEAKQQELEDKLFEVKASVEEFIATEDIPAVAKEIHQELVAKNEELLAQINQVVVDGHLALNKLQESEILSTIENVQGLLSRLENLGL
jgi:PBP1b-binding outer membrane lipoprotein LpoB